MLEKIINGTKNFCKKAGRTGLILGALYTPFTVGCGVLLDDWGEEEQSENIIKISMWDQNIPGNTQVGVEELYNLVISNYESGEQTLWYHIDWDYDGTFVADESVEFTILGNDFIDFHPTHTFTETGTKTSWVKVDLAPGETIGVDNESDYTVMVYP